MQSDDVNVDSSEIDEKPYLEDIHHNQVSILKLEEYSEIFSSDRLNDNS
jgi:hypothetical protein